MKHEFHFILNPIMKDEINKISKMLDKSISSTVNHILRIINPMLERYHYIYPENKNDGKYRLINGKKHIHVYMDENDYRRIKHVFAHMYIYSMAIIIRKMIQVFITGVKKHGLNKFEKIMKKYTGIHNAKFGKIQKKWKKYDIFIQMSCKKSIKQRYKITFTNNYTLLGFEFL
jgi:hypothetical protein